MAGDSDAKLTALAAEALRHAVEVFDQDDIDRWLVVDNTGSFPALSGSFAALTGSFAALTGSFAALGNGNAANAGAGLKQAFKLPRKLPAIRLPSEAQLAMLARSAPLMAMLEALARWLGRDGRLVTADHEFSAADVADAASRLRVRPQYLPFLLDYALTAGWLVLDDEPDTNRTWVVLGETAWRWADGDDLGTLRVWAAVLAAVLARTLDVAASINPADSRKLKFQGQGVATAVKLFQARRSGLSGAEVRNLVMSGVIGDRPSSRARRAWEGWVHGHGDPARWLLGELAALRAIGPPSAGDGAIVLTPLAQWALREHLRRDGIEIPLLAATSAQMTAAALVTYADGVSEAEFDAEFASWVGARGPDRAARELLAFAAFSGPRPRLATVNLVRRIDAAAHLAWREAMQRPELRGYAWIALAGGQREGAMPLDLRRVPDDLARVATDLLALACGEEEPDPAEIARQLSEAIPAGQESWVFGLMSQSSHPDVVKLLRAIGWCHPDRWTAKDARRAARSAKRHRVVSLAARVPARTGGR